MLLRTKKSGESITLGPQVGYGGQGAFYPVAGRADLGAKVLDHPPADLADRLAAMMASPPPGLLDLTAPASCAWPLDILVGADGRGACVGAVIPFVANRLAFGELVNPATRGPGVTYAGLVRAFRNVAKAVSLLHAHGVVVGDLSARNVLADDAGNVTLIDADSMQVTAGTRVFVTPVGTPDCVPPEWQGVPRTGDALRPPYDLFALGVLGFQALMDGVHPFAGMPTGRGVPLTIPAYIQRGWWMYGPRVPVRPPRHAPAFDRLPPPVRDLFRQCFDAADPLRRPAAQTWADELDAWLVAGVTPPGQPTGAATTGTTRQWPRWAARPAEWVRRHPKRLAAAAVAAAAVGTAGWWTTRPKQPESLGGQPTPALWTKLRPTGR